MKVYFMACEIACINPCRTPTRPIEIGDEWLTTQQTNLVKNQLTTTLISPDKTSLAVFLLFIENTKFVWRTVWCSLTIVKLV
jgi:Tfp pilus assembly protein PilZ